MGFYHINNRYVAINSTSTSTSNWYFVGDARQISVSFLSSASLGPSRFTIQGTNEDGFRSALPTTTSDTNVSLVSGVNMIGVTPGVITVDPGFRWMRVTVAPANHSTASSTTIVINTLT